MEHIDGNKQNNDPANLMVVPRAVNTMMMLERRGSPLAALARGRVAVQMEEAQA